MLPPALDPPSEYAPRVWFFIASNILAIDSFWLVVLLVPPELELTDATV